MKKALEEYEKILIQFCRILCQAYQQMMQQFSSEDPFFYDEYAKVVIGSYERADQTWNTKCSATCRSGHLSLCDGKYV